MLSIKVTKYYIKTTGVHVKNYYPLVIVTNITGGATISYRG